LVYTGVGVPVNVYVDGFNLYNGMFKKARVQADAKWLDLGAVALRVWPALAPINKVRYFTARVKPIPQDPLIVDRQDIYLRALAARGVDVHLGQFKPRTKKWFLDAVAGTIPRTMGATIVDLVALISKYEEKGSDVNLGAYLVRDAALKNCDSAIVISNDSDLAEAIRIATTDFGVPVYIINPHPNRACAELRAVGADVRELIPATVLKSMLPPVVVDAGGKSLTKPPAWT